MKFFADNMDLKVSKSQLKRQFFSEREMFERWFHESMDVDRPANVKECAWMAWEASKKAK